MLCSKSNEVQDVDFALQIFIIIQGERFLQKRSPWNPHEN